MIPTEEEMEQERELDMNGPEIVARCRWCGGIIQETDDYEPGDEGEGWMHSECPK